MRHFPFAVLVLFLATACQDQTKSMDDEPVARPVTQYTIEQFYKSSEVFGGAFSSDDRKLLVTSNESGIFNAYEIDIATGQKTARTNSTKESVYASSYVPGRHDFIYSSDKGGNEISHLYLKKDSAIKDLTPGEQEKANFGGWSRDGKILYYSSNKRNQQYFDQYKMDTATWTPVMIYKNDNGFDVAAMSDNERYLVLTQNLTTSSNNIYLVDQQTKQTKKINPDSVETNNYPLTFSKDNTTLFLITDDGSEFSYLLKYDIETGKKEKIYEANWDVAYMALSYNEKYRVIYVNEDGKNTLHLLTTRPARNLNFPKLKMRISSVSEFREAKIK